MANQAAGLGCRGTSRTVAGHRLECLNFAAVGGKRIADACDVGASRELVCAMPVARGGGHTGDGLEAATALV